MATANEQIRVSGRVKRQLERRRREGESFNDVLERVLNKSKGADFYDGFGILSDEDTEWIRGERAKSKEQRKERMQRFGEDT